MEKNLDALNQNELTNFLKTKDLKVLKSIYVDNYPATETLILKNNGSIPDAKRIYQDAFITTWIDIKNGKLKPKSNIALQKHIYDVSKHKWLYYSKRNKLGQLDIETYDNAGHKYVNTAMHTFNDLEHAAQQLLQSVYVEKQPLSKIAAVSGLDPSSIRSITHKSMQTLISRTLQK